MRSLRRGRAPEPALAPEEEIPRPLIAGGILLTIATFASIATNYLFQVLAGRLLGPSEYGLLGSLFTVIGVVTISASALQAASAKEVVSELVGVTPGVPGKREKGLARLLDDPLVRRTALIGVGITALTIAASPVLAAFLDAGVLDIIAFSLLVPSVGLVAIAFGRLQGLERFVGYAVLGLAMGLAKLVFGIAAIALGLGVSGGLFALAITSAVGTGAGLWYSQDGGPTPLGVVKADVFRALFAIGLFTLMISVDVPIARHFFESHEAGRFAAAAVVGHGVIWLPEVIAIVAFPEMVKARATRHDEHRLLIRSALLAMLMCLAGVVVLFVAGPFLFDTFYGNKYEGAAALSWKIALATVPFAVANMFLYDHLAGKRSRFIVIISLCAALEALGLALFHESATQYIAVIAVSGILLTALLTPWRRLRPPKSIAAVATDGSLSADAQHDTSQKFEPGPAGAKTV